MMPCGALRASSPSSTTVTTSSIWSWIFLFYFFLRFGCGDSFCTSRRRYAQKPWYTQSSFYAQIFLHREVCAQFFFCTQTPLHREVFTQRKEVFTHRLMLCTKMFLRAQIKAHRRSSHRTFSTEKFLHRTIFTYVFSTQKNLWHGETCTQKFLQTDFFALRNFTQNNFYTAETFSHRCLYAPKIYAQQFLQTDGFYTENFPHRSLTHRRFYAQHFLHTDVFTHTCFYTDTNCTQKLVRTYFYLHTANFYTERLCFPFLMTLPFVFPLSSLMPRPLSEGFQKLCQVLRRFCLNHLEFHRRQRSN